MTDAKRSRSASWKSTPAPLRQATTTTTTTTTTSSSSRGVTGCAHRREPAGAQMEKADAGTRTPDPFITSEVLYQLSYVGVCRSAHGTEARCVQRAWPGAARRPLERRQPRAQLPGDLRCCRSMGGIRSRLVLGAATVCCAFLSPAVARANTTAIATLSAESPISAGQGWLVWSVRSATGWSLDGYYGGRVVSLPVAPRPQPFDAQVGTNADGAPVVTYSRCRATPKMEDDGLAVPGSGTLALPNTGAGCRLRLLELNSGRERTPQVPEPRGVSDTTPAMWRGTLVFARKDAGHGRVSQIMLSLPRRRSQLVVLPHGAVPGGCPQRRGCREFPAGGEVQAMSIDRQIVAFVWRPEGPGVDIDGAWEERVDALAHRRGVLVGSPVGTESCTGGEEDLVEEEWPAPPLVSGEAALFPELELGGCYTRFTAALVQYREGRRRLGKAAIPIVELARDGADTYGLVAQRPSSEQDPGCSPALPCTLERVSTPPLRPSHYKPTHPFDY